MGQIMISVFVGAWMIFLGIFMNGYLTKEERRYRNEEKINN
ncbi:MAG: hypothetical protein N4A62_11260 [Marinisporobacter sp.]|jgi:hypothetical protein|nr:hypothetical protein [Marinisporobacter sp.]